MTAHVADMSTVNRVTYRAVQYIQRFPRMGSTMLRCNEMSSCSLGKQAQRTSLLRLLFSGFQLPSGGAIAPPAPAAEPDEEAMPKEDPSKLQRAQGEELEEVPLSFVPCSSTDTEAIASIAPLTLFLRSCLRLVRPCIATYYVQHDP